MNNPTINVKGTDYQVDITWWDRSDETNFEFILVDVDTGEWAPINDELTDEEWEDLSVEVYNLDWSDV